MTQGGKHDTEDEKVQKKKQSAEKNKPERDGAERRCVVVFFKLI